MKTCGCGKTYKTVPRDAIFAPDSIAPGWYYNCECHSTLLFRIDKFEAPKASNKSSVAFGLMILAALILLLTSGCATPNNESVQDFEAAYPCNEVNTEDDNRPDILVIGDSISVGYMPHAQAVLPNFDLNHNVCNGMSTMSGVRHIDKWLMQRPSWTAITFNHGLWDIADWIAVGPEAYRANLTIVAQKVKAATNAPLFILTTEVLPGTLGRTDAKVQQYNQIAIEVMQEVGIPVLDLYSVSQTIRNEHVNPTDVHYTEAGSQVLGEAVAQELFNLYGIQ